MGVVLHADEELRRVISRDSFGCRFPDVESALMKEIARCERH
jgi:hypothetical protein